MKFRYVTFLAISLSIFSYAYAKGQSAPLGLNWGISKKDVETLGVGLKPLSPGQFGETFAGKNFRKTIPDFATSVLYFGFNDKLCRILIASKTFARDSSGDMVKERYNEVKSLLTEKYGNPTKEVNYLTDESYFQDPNQFSYALYAHKAQVFTNWKLGKIQVQISIEALSINNLYYRVIYENTELLSEVGKKQKGLDKDAL